MTVEQAGIGQERKHRKAATTVIYNSVTHTVGMESAITAPPRIAARERSHPYQTPRVGHRTWRAHFILKLRLSDVLVSVVVLAVAFMVRIGADWTPGHMQTSEAWYLGICLLGVVLWNVDLEYAKSRGHSVIGSGVAEYRRVAQSTLRTFGVMAMLMVALGIAVPRGFFALAVPLGLGLLMLERWQWRRWLSRQRKNGRMLSTVVVVGSSQEAEYAVEQLERNSRVGYRVGGVVLTSLTRDMHGANPWQHMPLLHGIADIDQIVEACGAEAVVVAGELPGGATAIQELGWRLGDMDTELVLASSLTNVAGPRVHFRPVEGLPLMYVEMPHYSGMRHMIKRGMDVILSAAALLILSPVLAVMAVIVKRDSAGPVLFFQRRVGKNGQAFNMVKFRSMVVDAEAHKIDLLADNEGSGLLFKMAHDPRVTRCGRWMRKHSLDELPQFWNVLMGHMSLVGPRPPLLEEVAGYASPTRRRLLIKPGITGLWQISGRSDLPWEEAVRLDLYYVENWSLTGDIMILWRTLKVVVAPTGAY